MTTNVQPDQKTESTVDYRPNDPNDYDPKIALVGCGDITEHHLDGYTAAGYDVAVLCDIDEEQARKRRDEYYPDAEISTDSTAVFERDDVDVVDIATHPKPRAGLIEDAIRNGKHVLSQKPFVLDLDIGERLVELADEHDVKLAVNQNARWAPYLSYVRGVAESGQLGQIHDIHVDVQWNHDWIVDTVFDGVHHVILYDFAIHSFDLVACLLPDMEPERVFATTASAPAQKATPPLLGQAVVEYEGAQVSLVFGGNTDYARHNRTYVAGTKGTVESTGVDFQEQTVTVTTEDGDHTPDLVGSWYPTGFHGAMAELLSAIEEDREPKHSARNNLRSLELCYAAVASAEDGAVKHPGDIRGMPGSDGV